MLVRWKFILANWINCYSNENSKKEENVSLESLNSIISHLHDNLSLDESTSSLLEAQTLEEFIAEKYPEFKFEHGTAEAASDEDLYIAASLLLFFVCVISKDVDLKKAMCSKLSDEDQETIMKFSKCLMEYSPVTCKDVQAAITEACGLETASVNAKVSETPPALRSLHGEVRRLQAALDAERFDRNYLQDELARTNLTLDKLRKDKEQHKLEILNLKAKISMCCGGEGQQRGAEGEADNTSRLTRQLHDLEERLVVTQEKLDDLQYEKDIYKTKVDELKQERDKWLALSQEEATRVAQLCMELDQEKHNVQSLKEVLVELQKHNMRNNGLDTSQLEWDEFDNNVSLHNVSVCSEACANVIEVQLMEEKSKVASLTQTIQGLQDQVTELNQKVENETQKYETLLKEKQNEISDLKHRINEEIHEKNILNKYYDEQITKLNNELNELEQQLKDNQRSSAASIEEKSQEIHTLQEEKLSLTQRLSEETSKLEEIIKNLKADIDTEKNLKVQMKEGYENKLMKLNEKVLNRNNELVELQNNVFEKSEMIEKVNLEIRNGKQATEKLEAELKQMKDKVNELEESLQKKCEEAKELQRRLVQNVEVFAELNREIDELKTANVALYESNRHLEDTKTSLINELQSRDSYNEEIRKEIENITNIFSEEKDRLMRNLDERNTALSSLQAQMREEVQYKLTLEAEIKTLHKVKSVLSEELSKMKAELANLKLEFQEKERIIYALDLYLKEERHTNKNFKCEFTDLTAEYKKVLQSVNEKNKEIKELREKMEKDSESNEAEMEKLKKEINERDTALMLKEKEILEKGAELLLKEEEIRFLNDKAFAEAEEKRALLQNLTFLNEDKNNLEKQLMERCDEMLRLQKDHEKLCKSTENNNMMIEMLEKKLDCENKKFVELEKDFNTQTSNLLAKLNETEKQISEIGSKTNHTIEEQEIQIQMLKHEVDIKQKALDKERECHTKVLKEKEILEQQLSEEARNKDLFERKYQNKCLELEEIRKQLNDELLAKNEELQVCQVEIENLRTAHQEKIEENKAVEDKLTHAYEKIQLSIVQKGQEVNELKKKVEESNSLIEKLELELKKEVDSKTQAIQALQRENEQLQFTIEEDNSNHEVFIKEKDAMIERLEEHIKVLTLELESLKKDYEDGMLVWEKSKLEMRENLEVKENQIIQLNEHINELKQSLEQSMISAKKANDSLKRQIDEIDLKRKDQSAGYVHTIGNLESECEYAANQIVELKQKLNTEKTAREAIEFEKSILSQKIMEHKSLQEAIEEENRNLVDQKDKVQQRLTLELGRSNMLREENESLSRRIMALEEEQQCLMRAKDDLLKEVALLNDRIREEDAAKTLTVEEIKQVLQVLEEEKKMKEDFHRDKVKLLSQNDSLQESIEELSKIQELLVCDKETLMVEKEDLARSLSDEKSARDELESEKSALSDNLNEWQEKYVSAMNVKEEELNSMLSELKILESDYKKYEDLKVSISSLLSSGLEELFQNIHKEDISNEVLLKLIDSDRGDMQVLDQCVLLVNIAGTLASELSLKRTLEKALVHENNTISDLRDTFNHKELQVLELQSEVKRLQQIIHEHKIELSKQTESYSTSLDSKAREIQKLHLENKTMNSELNDVRVQLEVKVHSLKEKLVDNENLTDKLKKTYECQIDNLNVMINKLTSYLRDKAAELEAMRKEKERLQLVIEDNNKVIKTLEDEVKTQKLNQEKLISDFESERLVLKNMVTVTESVMEDSKVSLSKVISDHVRTNEALQEENTILQEKLENEKHTYEVKLQEKENAFETALRELSQTKSLHESLEKEMEILKERHTKEVLSVKEEVASKVSQIEKLESQIMVLKDVQEQIKKEAEVIKENLERDIAMLRETVKEKDTLVEHLQTQNNSLIDELRNIKNNITSLEELDNELRSTKDSLESELLAQIDKLTNVINGDTDKNDKFKATLKEKLQSKVEILDKVKILSEEIINLVKEKNQYISKLDELKAEFETNELKAKEELEKLKELNVELCSSIELHQRRILDLEDCIKTERELVKKIQEDTTREKMNLENKCALLQDYQTKAEKHLNDREREISSLRDKIEQMKSNYDYDQSRSASLEEKINELKSILNKYEQELYNRDKIITNMAQEKDTVISTISKELMEERATREKYQKELEVKATTLYELRQKLEEVTHEAKVLEEFRTENNDMMKASAQRDTCYSSGSHEKTSGKASHGEKDRDRHQVSNTSDLTHSSLESLKTINDLEKIIHDKNRTITTLQSDIAFLKSLMAESENKLLDVTKELDISKENCEQLSSQLKKIVQQKNEEIADLKKQISKLNLTETQSKQIIKLSAKYQAIILKRVAEIKSNTILKELTNFGNSNTDSDLKRSLTAGAITMEDLENFLETTDRHLRRCAEKQIALQKDRDRLSEVNKINESEIINSKKFLTELSVSFKTFASVREVYAQKLSRVVSIQRTVRREILNLDGQLTDSMMCKLERGYAAVMQDLAECTMNLERWMERCISRTISPEKIKQAFTSDMGRPSIASTVFQNASLEVQLEELEKSFQKLLEEVVRAPKGDGAKDPQAVTVMEVRAEYEDKLNRMKAKMKQLYQEQIAVFKENQKKEIAILEKELLKAREKLAESSRAYEDHIKGLTTELWNVGERFLVQKEENEWHRKQKSGSLMSLQHVHSSGLLPSHHDVLHGRPSDSHSMRSLPVSNMPREKREGRALYMSDEEGEVFDNRCLKELANTPKRRESISSGQRLSELRWRNSLCPPHLKSSYPAETQFRDTLDEEDIKASGVAPAPARQNRKEVGITAYKKPGPPTPSKQAGRVSATDSELRESLRPEPSPRKMSTPSRLRALFRSRADDGTPRSKRLSIFRKK